MDKIAKRLKDYIEAHPFDPGDSDCETVQTIVRIKRPGPIDQVFLCVDADKIASLSENNKIIVI